MCRSTLRPPIVATFMNVAFGLASGEFFALSSLIDVVPLLVSVAYARRHEDRQRCSVAALGAFDSLSFSPICRRFAVLCSK